MASAAVCARHASATSRATTVSPHQSRKLLRKPWGTASRLFSGTSVLSVESESSRPVGLGNTSPELSGSLRAVVSASSAGAESGTRWGRPFLARSAGTVQSLALQSISSQRAPRTPPLRAAVRTRKPKASFVPAHAPEAYTVASAAATSLWGSAS